MFINDTNFRQNMAQSLKTMVFSLLLGVGLCVACSSTTQAQVQAQVPIQTGAQTLAGDSEALYLFEQAKTYHDGQGVEVDLDKARGLYEQASDLGNLDARINLGYMYFIGQGVLQDYAKARTYYLPAAKAGDKAAQRNLGLMYEHGLGVNVDMLVAQSWYDKSTEIVAIKKPVVKQVEKIKSTPALVKTEAPKPEITISEPVVETIAEASIHEETEVSQAGTPQAQVIQTSTFQTGTFQTGKWVGTAIALFLLFAALASAIWYGVQMRRIQLAKQKFTFAQGFFERYRESLRGSFLRTPYSHRQFLYLQDPWSVSLCALMVRFALSRHADEEIQCKISDRIVSRLNISPQAARLETFEFVPMVQDRLFSDIEHLSSDKLHPPRPFQFKHTEFSTKLKKSSLTNLRSPLFRVVK